MGVLLFVAVFDLYTLVHLQDQVDLVHLQGFWLIVQSMHMWKGCSDL